MGRVIILPNVDFSGSGLGRVTLSGNIPLRIIGIVAPSTFTGLSVQLKASYAPLNTTQRGVTWSIVSGTEYALVNETTGVMTILPGASENNVTVKATSTEDSDIMTSKTITVTYHAGEPIIHYAIGKQARYDTGAIDDATDRGTTEFYEIPSGVTVIDVTNSKVSPFRSGWYGMHYVARCYDSNKNFLGTATPTGLCDNIPAKSGPRTLLANTKYIRLTFAMNDGTSSVPMTNYYTSTTIVINNNSYYMAEGSI